MLDLIERKDALDCLDREDFDSYEDYSRTYDAIEDIPAVNRWIPCSEQMMPDGERVLMRLTNGEIFVMTRNKDLISDGLRHLRDLSAVTDWMPLPEPPESEVQE